MQQTPGDLIRTARARARLSQRALARRAGTSPSSIALYERDERDPGVATLERVLRAAGFGLHMALTDLPVGVAARPVSIPRDLDRYRGPKAEGKVVLPLHVRWSGPERTYDLADRRDRARVYEQVMREGLDDDVRRFVDVDEVIEMWDDLVLPRHVRRAWSDWVRRHRGLDLAC
ncbi:MAG: helix-turn-helix transcriptional regulator [Actinobacteria bacterium]|nr:helix-turn-helix transcriptional regulator [Actinomycetota bacterium]